MVVLQELSPQGFPSFRSFRRGSEEARFSISSSVRVNIQPSVLEQMVQASSVTKFWNTTTEDRKIESMVALLHARDLSVSPVFVRGVVGTGPFRETPLLYDARRCSHGRASGS